MVAIHAAGGSAGFSLPPAVTVRGVLIGRFRLTDGRPADTHDMIVDMLAAFEPGTVPIKSSHAGFPVGTLDSLEPWDALALDLAFTGHVAPYPDLLERLRQGVGVSMEQWAPPGSNYAGPGWVSREHNYFRGTRGPGWQLVGVALTDKPAAAGSVMWARRTPAVRAQEGRSGALAYVERCLFCGEPLLVQKRGYARMYCDAQCAYRAKVGWHELTCVKCGAAFMGSKGKRCPACRRR